MGKASRPGELWRQPAAVYFVAAAGLLIHATALYFKARDPGHSVAATIFGGVSAALFLGAGVVAQHRRPENRVGILMILVGLGSVAEDIRFMPWPITFTLGLALSAASSGFVVHLVLAFPAGHLTSRPQRGLAVTAYVAALVMTPFGALFADPRTYGHVYPPNLFLIYPSQTVIDVNAMLVLVIGVLVATGVVAVLIRRWIIASAPQRRILFPVFLTGSVGAVASLAGFVSGDNDLTRNILLPVYRIAFCLLPLGFLAGVLRARMGRTALSSLMIDLQRPLSAADLQRRLAIALGDSSLRVGYWRAEPAGLVTADGVPMPLPAPDSGKVVTFVERGGRRVAGLVHDAALRERPHVLEAAAAAAGLMLDNQRLTAEVRAQFGEVRASRARIAAAGARERRRMERDLHDGVQQSLVAAVIGIRMVEQRLDADTARTLRELVRACGDGVDTALAELRELARGLHPAILSEAGLVAALEALVERAPVLVELNATVGVRPPPLTEETAYLVVAEALTNAMKHAGASTIRIVAGIAGDRLRVDVIDDGIGGADAAGSGLLGLADRVHAIDGDLSVRSERGRGTVVSAVLPLGER